MGESEPSPEEVTITPERAQADGKFVLVVVLPRGVVEFDLDRKKDSSVGRSSRADIQIDTRSVSRIHAIFTGDGETLRLQDHKSTNGTYINGRRLTDKAIEVHPGDAIRFGEVMAQLRGVRGSRLLQPRVVRAHELDARLLDEAERCLRYDRSLCAVAIDSENRGVTGQQRLQQAILDNLRALDVLTTRAPGRLDALVVECSREDAMDIADRIRASLAKRSIDARVGVAAYPQDVPSPESLFLAAQSALHATEAAGVGGAGEGSRVLHLGEREIVVGDPAMTRLFGLVERVAPGRIPVLIHGETGSGKEIVAEAIHALSPRVKHRLVKLNCAAMPETLLESELFGHEKGAFSGAEKTKPGLFEEADAGTIFLDEIGEMSPPLQAKLLRVLEDGCVRRVGATKERAVDVRIVAATHRDLKSAANDGQFRQDLYFRLSAMVLQVPPLRDRPREIPLLAERFAAEAAKQAGRDTIGLGESTLEAMRKYAWPGNVRELRNAMHAAAMMCEGDEIEVQHLPPDIAGGAVAPVGDADEGPFSQTGQMQVPSETSGLSLEDELKALERQRIAQALEACGGNQTQAAKVLGMPRRTLVYKLGSLGIEVPTRRKRSRR